MSEREEKRLRARILKAFEETGSIRATVRRTGVSRKTVRRVLRGKARAAPKTLPKRPSKLDAFRPVIQRLVLDDQLTAVLVLEEIRELGYAGGYSILKEFIRTVRPQPKLQATTVIDHPPGKEGQVDWSPAPPERVRRWLEGLDVETGDLTDYDRIIDRLGGKKGDDTDDKE